MHSANAARAQYRVNLPPHGRSQSDLGYYSELPAAGGPSGGAPNFHRKRRVQPSQITTRRPAGKRHVHDYARDDALIYQTNGNRYAHVPLKKKNMSPEKPAEEREGSVQELYYISKANHRAEKAQHRRKISTPKQENLRDESLLFQDRNNGRIGVVERKKRVPSPEVAPEPVRCKAHVHHAPLRKFAVGMSEDGPLHEEILDGFIRQSELGASFGGRRAGFRQRHPIHRYNQNVKFGKKKFPMHFTKERPIFHRKKTN